ncbi:ABC transporter permease [Paenibacillus lentus]|uniref:Uncharacterized protein n=1 Tax=Paenibacillus lentus TaxID=1338368 RepID=A0A3Q8SAE4_9BACL|nr:hypothetical protein [Paenibacillus lentus]AZK46138.1 hypothetical protein EIM92_07980 [Paenibacillus lentus]
MVKWRRQFVLEVNHIFRNPWLMGLPALYGVLYALNLSDVSPYNNFFNHTYSFHSLAQTLTLGIVMLLGILVIRRDISRPTYEWSSGLPLSYGTRITAKYAAVMAYLTLFSLLAVILFIVFSYGKGIESKIILSHSAYFFFTYELSYMVTLALAMLLAVCLPNRIVYLIGFCAWMFGTFFMQLFIVERYNLFVLRIFHLNQFFVDGNRGYELWGYGLDVPELLRSGLFVLAFSTLLQAAAITILNLQRPTKHSVRLWVTAVLPVLLACGAFVPYGLLWQERYSSYYGKMNDDTIPEVVQLRSESNEAFEVVNYDLTLERTKNDVISAVARLDIPASTLLGKEEIQLTLNRAFTVSHVEAFGSPLPFAQQGDWLAVSWSGALEEQVENVTLEIRYSGAVMEYNGRGGFHAFVYRDQVLLPSYYAWYPLPGQQDVYVKDDWSNMLQMGTVFKPMPYPDATYRLAVKGFDTGLFTSLPELESTVDADLNQVAGESRIFQGRGKEGLSIFGGPFVEVSDSIVPSRIITTPGSRKLAEHVLEEWSRYYEYFTSWVTDFKPKIHQVGFLQNQQTMPISTENGMYILVSQSDGDSGYAGLLMNEMLLGKRSGSYLIENTREDVRMPLRSLMWYVYYREADGLSHRDIENGMANFRMLGALFHAHPDQDPDHLGDRMVKQVGKALDEGKFNEVKEVLNVFYSQGLEIPMEGSDSSVQARPIPYDAWEREWKKVMGDENGA